MFPYKNLKPSETLMIIHTPRFTPTLSEWLWWLGADYGDVLYQIFLMYTPDGEEAEYYDYLDGFLYSKGLLPGTHDYLDGVQKAKECLLCIMNQINSAQYFDLLIRTTITSFVVQGEFITIVLDQEI